MTGTAQPSRIKYYVEIYRGEEEGGLKTVEFEKKRAALEFAERQHQRGYAVIVFDKNGKKIYDEQ